MKTFLAAAVLLFCFPLPSRAESGAVSIPVETSSGTAPAVKTAETTMSVLDPLFLLRKVMHWSGIKRSPQPEGLLLVTFKDGVPMEAAADALYRMHVKYRPLNPGEESPRPPSDKKVRIMAVVKQRLEKAWLEEIAQLPSVESVSLFIPPHAPEETPSATSMPPPSPSVPKGMSAIPVAIPSPPPARPALPLVPPEPSALTRLLEAVMDSTAVQWLKDHFFIGFLIEFLCYALCYAKIFRKASEESWQAFIPFYNQYIAFKVAGYSGWWALAYYLTMPLRLFGFIPGVFHWALGFTLVYKLAKRFGKGDDAAILFALVKFVGLPLLAFGPSSYAPTPLLSGTAPERTATGGGEGLPVSPARPRWINFVGVVGILIGLSGMYGSWKMSSRSFLNKETERISSRVASMKNRGGEKEERLLELSAKLIERNKQRPPWYDGWLVVSAWIGLGLFALYLLASLQLIRLKPKAIPLFYAAAEAAVLTRLAGTAVSYVAMPGLGLLPLGLVGMGVLVHGGLFLLVLKGEKGLFKEEGSAP